MGAGGDAVIIMMEYLSHETQTWVQFKNFKDTSHKVIAQSLHLSSGEAAWNKYKHGPASQAASVLTVLLLQRKTRRCDCVFPLVCMGVYDRYRTESERQMWMRDATQCACVCVCVHRKRKTKGNHEKIFWQLEKTLNKVRLDRNLWQFVSCSSTICSVWRSPCLNYTADGFNLECELINSKLWCYFSSAPAASANLSKPPHHTHAHTWSFTCLVLKYCSYWAC